MDTGALGRPLGTFGNALGDVLGIDASCDIGTPLGDLLVSGFVTFPGARLGSMIGDLEFAAVESTLGRVLGFKDVGAEKEFVGMLGETLG
jgi:hypothetical protein